MQRDNRQNGNFSSLRKRAELWLSGQKDTFQPPLTIDETRKLIHELHTHQIELELQNEDLRLAQVDLEESRRKYTDLYEFAPIGYLTVGANGLIEECNLTFATMLGLNKPQILRRAFSSFIPHEDHHIFSHFRKRLLISGHKQKCELRLLRNDQSIFYALLESKIKLELDGDIGQFRMTLSDISDRKLLEKDLRQSQEEWENTFDSICDCITLQDSDFRIVKANKATSEMFGIEPGALNGKYCFEIFRGSDTLCLNCPGVESLQHLSTNSGSITHEKLGKTFHVTCSPLRTENNGPLRIVHIARDVTVQIQDEAERLQTQKMEAIGTLAGGIAHDFNNILTAILGYAHIIHTATPISSPSRSHIEHIVKAANRAKELIKQILAFSRKNQGDMLPLELAPIIKEVLKLMRASIPSTVEIHEEIDSEPGTILAHPINIHQVLVNLCTNAVHSMENERGILDIQLHRVNLHSSDSIGMEDAREGSFMELVVSDTGCGMTEDTQKHMFEPYFTTKGITKGSGLGLSVVHGIVKSCGGFINVLSEPGHGTTFRIYFPILENKEIATGQKQERAIPSGNERILAVDDDEVIVEMYKLLLEPLGYTVKGFTSSREALEYFRSSSHNVDLVITDQTMPYLTGAELVQQIIKICPDMPVILCTGHSSLISGNTAAMYGVKSFMMKPLTRLELAVTVRNVLDEATAARQGD